MKLWFLKLIAKFLESAGDDGVQVHIGTSSGHRGGDPSIRVNVKGNDGGRDDEMRRWTFGGERNNGGGIRLNIDAAADKRNRKWWDGK